MANAPTFIAKGTFGTGTAAVSPGIPAGITNEDFLLLIVESANQAITAPAGWTEVPGSPQSTGTAAVAGGVRLGVFYKGVGGVETAPSVADTGDHTNAIILAFRGVDLQNPFNVTPVGRVDAAATASMTWSTVTTTKDNCLIVLATALDQDIAGTAQVGAVTNAALSGITEYHDQTVIAGAGGGVHIAGGLKATAGAVGTSSATGAASTTHAYLTIPLQGAEPVVRTVGQYEDDFTTPVPVGANTLDGISTDLYLQAEYDSGYRTMATTPKAEVDPVGTSFNGTPSSTHRGLTQIGSSTTRNLRGSTLIYDNHNKRYIWFGGYDGTTRYNEVWERYCDKPGQPWRKLAPTGTPPTGRNLHGACYVKGNLTSGGAVRAYMIVWGGADPSDKNDMLALRLDTPGSEAWTTITQTSAPTVRSYVGGHLVATPGTDSSNNFIYLYGGWAAVRENQLVRCTFDVDAPTAVTWTTLKASGTAGNPPQQTGVVMDYKASTNKLYLYGGYNGTTYYNTFWEYDVAGNTFTNTTPTGTAPTASEVVAGGYDSANNRFWFTGGWTTNGTFSTSLNQIGYISDVGGSEAYNIVRANTLIDTNQHYAGNSFAGFCVNNDLGHLQLKGMATVDSNERYGYIIDFNEGATTEFPVYGETEGEYFNARDAMASVWNPVAEEWLNIGGFDDMWDDLTIPTGTHSGDIWVYDQKQNAWRYANQGFKSLPPLEGRIACYDTTRDRVLIFGGLTGVTEVSNEVWELVRDSNGNYKANPLRPTGTKPGPRWLGACVYDASADRMIIALGGNGSGPINDVWELSFTGSAQGAWTQRTPTGSVTGVAGVGFANKASNTRLYIFGGATNSALTTVSSQLCYLDYSTTNCAWTVVSTTGATARRTPAMDYDVVNDRLMVFGGYNGSASINTMSTLALSGTTWVNLAPTLVPDARRSTIGMVMGGRFYITGGRSDSDRWYRNTWELSPNYGTPNSSIWANKYPASFTPVYHTTTGGSSGTSYHWQAWTTEGSIDSTKVSYPSQENTYFFDASDAGPTDPDSAWTNEANAVDGSLTTFATYNGALSAGSNSVRYLGIEGTNAPGSGGAILSVKARFYNGDVDSTTATISTDTQAEQIGTIAKPANGSTMWSDFTTLTTPSGGWTWAKLQALEVRVFKTASPSGNLPNVARVEIVVLSTNDEASADFILGAGTPTYTKTQTTDAMKHTLGTKTHTVDADMRDNKHYTKESNPSLPTTATPRSEAFLKAEVTTVAADDSTYVDETGEQYLLYYFERWHTNSTDQISATWNGKSTEAPTSKTVYLQIWNKTTSGWETLQSNSAAAANTDFTLTGGKTTSLSDYYDTGNKVVFRVYQ